MSREARRAWRLAGAALLCLAGLLPPCAAESAPPRPPASVEEERLEGVLVARRAYDDSGALAEETLYGADGSLETRVYRRVGGRLARIEAKDGQGRVLGAIDYRYDGSGRLIGVLPSGGLGSGVAGMIASGASPSATWVSDGATLTLQRLDGLGRPVRVETLSGGQAVSRSSYAYGEGALPERSEEEDLASGRAIVSSYDAAGRVLLRVESLKGTELSRREFRYDAEGRLVEERTRGRSPLLLRSFAYDEAGELAREETRRDGVMAEAVERAGEFRIVESYSEGKLFARGWFAEGRKVREEFYEDGLLIRSKEYR